MHCLRWPDDDSVHYWLPGSHHTRLSVFEKELKERGVHLPDTLMARTSTSLCHQTGVATASGHLRPIDAPGVWMRLRFDHPSTGAGEVAVTAHHPAWPRGCITVVDATLVAGSVACLVGQLPLPGAAVWALVLLDTAGDPIVVAMGLETNGGPCSVTCSTATEVSHEEDHELARAVRMLMGTYTVSPPGDHQLYVAAAGHGNGIMYVPPSYFGGSIRVDRWEGNDSMIEVPADTAPDTTVYFIPERLERVDRRPLLDHAAPMIMRCR